MPTYTARCSECETVIEYVTSISNCLDCPPCGCGGATTKVILQAPRGFVLGKFEAFRSTVDGTVITNQRALREHNRRNDVVSLSDGYSEEKIQSGDFNKKKQVAALPDVRQDLQEAVHMVQNGYKPTIEVHDE